jgi:hypothetical protein
MKKKLKKVAIVLGIVTLAALTLFILWTSWENWSGAREWEKIRTRLVENDVKLDAASLIPSMPPKHDNFCAAPIVASLLEYDRPGAGTNFSESVYDEPIVYRNPTERQRLLALKIPDLESGNGYPNWSSATFADLQSIRQALPGNNGRKPSILEWMKQFQPELDDLDAAAKRPEATMPFSISDNFLANISMPVPPLQEFQQLTRFQMIRACAALEAGDNAQAIAALEGIFQIQKACSSHPTLIGFLVGQFSLNSCVSVVWQGMALNQWSTDDLLWIQTRLQKVDLLSDLERALNFEMVTLQIGATDFLKNISIGESIEVAGVINPLGSSSSDNSSAMGLLALAVPSGIWDHNKAFGCRVIFEQGILPVRERRFPDEQAFIEEFKDRSRRNFLAAIALPATSQLIEKAYHGAVSIDLAIVACAVERHYLKTGNYCEALENLLPAYLEKIPLDLVKASTPLHYGKGLHGDRYRIYSVGQNGADDGGTVTFGNHSANGRKRDLELGDWAWGYSFEEAPSKPEKAPAG